MRFIVVALIFLSSTFAVLGQSDSTILTYKEYLENILNYHPIAKKAALKLKLAKAETLAAQGTLDPLLTANWNQKNFDDKLYYRQYQAKLKFPTRYGVDVVGGYENTEGVFLNPEHKTDDFGLWHLGVEVNVLQGLLVNERITALEQAKVFQELAKNEQQLILNDLVYNASAAYLTWQQYFSFKIILEENTILANSYFDNTKQSFFAGEKTAMDTLEAFVLYQDAISFLQKNELGLIKAKQYLENYLWFQQAPVILQESTKPENYKNQLFQEIVNFSDSTLSKHPAILASLNKLSYVEIAQRLKREKLKPKLKLKYNPLLATGKSNILPNYSFNNFKWGIDFSMPLLRRKEKANIQKGMVKIEEIKLDLQNKRNELSNKIESSWQQQLLLQKQKTLLSKNVESYQKLLEGENIKFNFGESSVFLLTKRQEKYINGQLKLIDIYIKQQIELLNFLYYSNQLLP